MADWTEAEVEIAVQAYLEMLRMELKGERYNKTEYRRRVLPELDGRSHGSLEFKNCNISAVMHKFGYPAIDGYKPRWNIQKSVLPEIVSRLIRADSNLEQSLREQVESMEVDLESKLLQFDPDPPQLKDNYRFRESTHRIFEPKHINYLEIEAHNRNLGLAGEKLVVGFERARLIEAGKEVLASEIEHVSKEQGDGAGFDILSFDEDGAERFIEVKTTRYSKHTPFFISENEVQFSKQNSDQFQLYRVFGFKKAPRVFTLPGDIRNGCNLSPTTYRASFDAN